MARSPSRRGGRSGGNGRGGATSVSPRGRAASRARPNGGGDGTGAGGVIAAHAGRLPNATSDRGADGAGAGGATTNERRDDDRLGETDDANGRSRAPRDRDGGGIVDGTDDPASDGEDAFRLSKAPPLTQTMIDELNTIEARRVLARWSARMRSVKRRVEDCARQFPTSSLVLVFTKPFRSADNQHKWCVKLFARPRRDLDATPAPMIELTDTFCAFDSLARQG